MNEDKLKELSEITGVDIELIKELGIENLTEDKLNLLENVFDLYLTDKEGFSEFITDSGIGNLAQELDNHETKDQKELANNLIEILKNTDKEVDLDI